MKKRLVVLLLVFSTIVLADVPYDSVYAPVNTTNKEKIPRYQDFPLDNIHILRLQDASMSLGRNVSVVQKQLADYQTKQTSQIRNLQESVDNLQHALQVKVEKIESSMQNLPQPPKPDNTPFKFLFISNIILFGIVVILLFLIHKKPLPPDHVHPAPPELVEYILSSKKNSHELRAELLRKGWKPVFIENAMRIARR